ncbi:MAG: hypothetical protein VKL59_02515 [Nostocaceae cyanobacterium]|nr:hypothetical protein [Nostocaceae cyanobacterium]
MQPSKNGNPTPTTPELKKATIHDLSPGMLCYYAGHTYQVQWVDTESQRVKIRIPNLGYNQWYRPYGGSYLVPTTWEIPVSHPWLMVWK